MEYIRRYHGENGFTRLSGIGDAGLQLTEFGIINLPGGGEYADEGSAYERALIILGGDCTISGDGFEFAVVNGRKDVFSGKPYAAYIPSGKGYVIRTAAGVEAAVAASPSLLEADPYLISPADVKEADIGSGNYARSAYLVLTDAYPAEHLFIGEAFVPSGNHASYPPHRHDYDNLPEEVDMEEIYFFRFNPAGGYGIQRVYTDDKSVDAAFAVRNNYAALLEKGYHPVVNAPGYAMYYLWIMAGKNHRKFVNVIDPEHKWIIEK